MNLSLKLTEISEIVCNCKGKMTKIECNCLNGLEYTSNRVCKTNVLMSSNRVLVSKKTKKDKGLESCENVKV